MLKHIDSSELSQRGFMDLARESDHQLILKDRYDPKWPSPAERRSAPPASLAVSLQRRLDAEHLEELPPSVSETNQDWEYLANRLRRTHIFIIWFSVCLTPSPVRRWLRPITPVVTGRLGLSL
ncbi:hypothetical protein [Synechococcus sp. MIT S9504]